jgi:hypothetical protein
MQTQKIHTNESVRVYNMWTNHATFALYRKK